MYVWIINAVVWFAAMKGNKNRYFLLELCYWKIIWKGERIGNNEATKAELQYLACPYTTDVTRKWILDHIVEIYKKKVTEYKEKCKVLCITHALKMNIRRNAKYCV